MMPTGRLGDLAHCPADSHGCPACSHVVTGPAVTGSPDVLINHLPALRDSDSGVHGACCGPGTWTAAGGASTVFINGKRVFRMGDTTRHCGGSGQLIVGSADTLVGDEGPQLPPDLPPNSLQYMFVDELTGAPAADVQFYLELKDGRVVVGRTDLDGRTPRIWTESNEVVELRWGRAAKRAAASADR